MDFVADLRRLPGDLADAARGPRLLRQGRRAGVRAQAQLHLGRRLPAQHLAAGSSRSGRRARPAASSAWWRRSASSPARPRERQVKDAKIGLVSGFGMINYDRGLGSGAAILAADAEAKEPGPAHPAADAAAGGAQPRRARPHRRRGARPLRAAAVPRLRGGAVPAARSLPEVPFDPPCTGRRSTARASCWRRRSCTTATTSSSASGCRGAWAWSSWTAARPWSRICMQPSDAASARRGRCSTAPDRRCSRRCPTRRT